MCQSPAEPFVAEYWHIGAITIRFSRRRSPIRRGSNRWLIKRSSNLAALVMDAFCTRPGPAQRCTLPGAAPHGRTALWVSEQNPLLVSRAVLERWAATTASVVARVLSIGWFSAVWTNRQ